MLEAKITAFKPKLANKFDPYDRIEFTLDNGDDVGMIDTISVALVCFLIEHNEAPRDAFGLMLQAIYDADLTDANAVAELTGRVFKDADAPEIE